MATEIIAAAAVEMAKFALQQFFDYAQRAGLTEEQKQQMYDQAKADLLARDPANLPDVT